MNAAKRVWRYVRAAGEDKEAHYVSSDGYEVWKVTGDNWLMSSDFYWQVFRPGDTEDTINHQERYCTAKAAKASISEPVAPEETQEEKR